MDTLSDLQQILNSWNNGDESAKERLIQRAMDRLYSLASRMMKRDDRVRGHQGSRDLAHDAFLRLNRSLDEVRPTTAEQFLRLSSVTLRRALIDEARRLFGPQGIGTNEVVVGNRDSDDDAPGGFEPTIDLTPSRGAAAGETWMQFYEEVERLPDDQKNVFDLIWFQRLTKPEAAQVLGVDEKTVRNRLNRARVKLGRILGELDSFFD